MAAIETHGIDIVTDEERTAKPRNLFLPWFASNISVFGMSYGAWVLGFGISFWQATLAAVLGSVLSFMICGVIAIGGKRGSVPTMVMSRSAFGVNGAKVPGIVSWITSIGWETSLAITAVLATSTIFRRLGWVGDDDTMLKIVSAGVVAVLIVLGAVAGYHIIMKMQSVLTWLTGITTIIYIILVFPHVNWENLLSIPNGSVASTIGAMTMVMTGMGLGWVNIAADWSRYQSRDAKDSSIVFWNTLGGSLGPVVLITFGAMLAGSDPQLADAVNVDPVGALASLLPTWFLIPFLITAILSLLSGAINGIYSSGLTLLTLGIKIPRPVASLIDGVILTAGTVFVVFFSPDFIGPFQSFLITLGVPLAAWAGIMMADIAIRKKPYDETALFDPKGRYGSINWSSLIILAIACFIGWGLVVNGYAEDAPWNNWQGYLLRFIGGEDGVWAAGNIGVILALIIGFVAYYAVSKSKIVRQEAEQGDVTQLGSTSVPAEPVATTSTGSSSVTGNDDVV